MNKRPKLGTFAKIAVTIILLLLVFRSVDLAEIRSHLSQIEPGYLAFLLLLHWVVQAFCAQRWRLFARSAGLQGSYRSFLQMYFIGMFFSVGLPSLVGGDAIKAYMASRKSGGRLSSGLASVLQDRASGLLMTLGFGSLAGLLCPLIWRGIPLRAVYGFVWVGVIGVLLLAWKGEGIYARWINPETKSLFQKLLNLIANFHKALARLNLSPFCVFQIVVISVINSALVIGIAHQVARSADQPVSFIAFAVLIPLIDVITMLPVSLAGIGIREWALIEALALLGVERGAALAIGLTLSALLVLRNLGGALFLPSVPAEWRRRPE